MARRARARGKKNYNVIGPGVKIRAPGTQEKKKLVKY